MREVDGKKWKYFTSNKNYFRDYEINRIFYKWTPVYFRFYSTWMWCEVTGEYENCWNNYNVGHGQFASHDLPFKPIRLLGV